MVAIQALFASPGATYRPGDMVTGRVRLQLTHTVTLRGIELSFQGYSFVKWEEERRTEENSDFRQIIKIPYESQELYYRSQFFVYGDAYAQSILHAGEYNFTFTMQLPLNLPSSFEGDYGHIRHEMNILTYPTIGNTPATCLLKVVNPLNLNMEPNIKTPVRVMDEKTLCCWCCSSSPVSCALFLPAGGFSLGQNIPVTIDVDNLSGTTVKGVTVTLQRVDTFTAVRPERKTRKATHTLAVQQLHSVPERSSITWERNILVPDGPPSGLRHCSIISSEYSINVEVELPLPHVNLTISAPITVGNIPLVIADPPAYCSLPPHAMNSTYDSSAPPPPYPDPVPSAPIASQEVLVPGGYSAVPY